MYINYSYYQLSVRYFSFHYFKYSIMLKSLFKHFLLLATLLIVFASCENKKSCPLCIGRGFVSTLSGVKTCPACGGEKKVSEEVYEAVKKDISNMMQQNAASSMSSDQSSQNVRCPMCSGSGVFSAYGNSSTCSGCQGSGFTTPEKAAKLRQALQQVDQMTGGGGYGGTSIDDGNYGGSSVSGSNNNSDRSCHSCGGTGDCQHCHGVGVVEYEGQYNTPDGYMKCPICHGSKKCNVCHGRGSV